VLQTLLRHALLREIADAAARVATQAPNSGGTSLLRDAELNDLASGSPLSATFKRQLETKVAAITGIARSARSSKMHFAMSPLRQRRPHSPRSPSFVRASRRCRDATAKRCSS
jgi:hypothetical protein